MRKETSPEFIDAGNVCKTGGPMNIFVAMIQKKKKNFKSHWFQLALFSIDSIGISDEYVQVTDTVSMISVINECY